MFKRDSIVFFFIVFFCFKSRPQYRHITHSYVIRERARVYATHHTLCRKRWERLGPRARRTRVLHFVCVCNRHSTTPFGFSFGLGVARAGLYHRRRRRHVDRRRPIRAAVRIADETYVLISTWTILFPFTSRRCSPPSVKFFDFFFSFYTKKNYFQVRFTLL